MKDGVTSLDGIAAWVKGELAGHNRQKLFVLGITGAQGTGKTTLAKKLMQELTSDGLRVASFSIDDFYLTLGEREELKLKHPFLKYRGLFGTHDVSLLMKVMGDLEMGVPTAIPVFDKSLSGGAGDRLPLTEWQTVADKLDVVVVEGWCVGARPVEVRELSEPINEIEKRIDSTGEMRKFVNDSLQNYQDFFNRLNALVVLHVHDVKNVYDWRQQQEDELRNRNGAGMTDAQVHDFIDYFLPTTQRYIWPLAQSEGEHKLVVAVESYRGVKAVS